ncbi:MAG: GntR family transcriptional regulator [Terriglobales bacterium]
MMSTAETVTARGAAPARPLYARIQEELAGEIRAGLGAGRLRPGDFFTTERLLCRRFGVSAITAKRALDELEAAGQLTRHRGRGTHVAQPRIQQVLDHFYRFTTHVASQGLEPSWRNRRVAVERPGPEVAARLKIKRREKVVAIERLRLVNGEPFFWHTSFVPLRLFPGLEAKDHAQRSLYEIFASDYQRPPVSCQESYEPVLLHQQEARLLGVRPRAAGMKLERLTLGGDGQALEFSSGLLRGDRCRLTVELR